MVNVINKSVLWPPQVQALNGAEVQTQSQIISANFLSGVRLLSSAFHFRGFAITDNMELRRHLFYFAFP